jgi:HEPN domain-containing protein
MTKKEIIDYWVNSSDNDYKVMNSLLDKKHYVWALFIGHLVLEKLLKAYYVKAINIEVPYIHDLTKIAVLSNLTLSEEQKDFLDEVTTFNIKVRYPDYKNRFRRKATKEFTEQYLKKIKKFRSWLREQIID